MPKVIILVVPLVVAVALAVVLAAVGDDGDGPASAAARTAPLAPPRVPARPPDVVTDAPGEDVEAEEARAVQLPLPDPESFRPGTPRRAMAEFMDAWHDRAWDRMATWTSAAWRNRYADPSEELRRRYAPFVLRGWTVEDSAPADLISTFDVLTAQRDLAPKAFRERLRVVLVNELPDGALTGTGSRRWAVVLGR